MEEVLKLKELQIRKKIKNSAFRNGIIGFVVVTLFSALDSTTFGEMFSKGLIYGSLGFVVVMLFGNRSWLRLKKKYLAPKYSNLEKLGLDLNQHLYFEGVYKGYYLNIVPFERKTKEGKINYFDVVQIFYQSKDKVDQKQFPVVLKYHVGYLFFYDVCVVKTYLNDNSINFKNDLDYIISVLLREDYLAISKDELLGSAEV